jgi:hypothetical protein
LAQPTIGATSKHSTDREIRAFFIGLLPLWI